MRKHFAVAFRTKASARFGTGKLFWPIKRQAEKQSKSEVIVGQSEGKRKRATRNWFGLKILHQTIEPITGCNNRNRAITFDIHLKTFLKLYLDSYSITVL